MSGEAQTITANLTPDLDDWGWDSSWSCEQWIQWHKAMKAAWGQEKANYRFIYWWDQQTMGASGYDCRSFNSSFREYARENGFLDALFSGIGVLAAPIGWTIDAAGNIADIAGNAVEAGEGVSKVLKVLLPVLVVVAVFFIVVYGYKQLKAT